MGYLVSEGLSLSQSRFSEVFDQIVSISKYGSLQGGTKVCLIGDRLLLDKSHQVRLMRAKTTVKSSCRRDRMSWRDQVS